VRWRRRRRVGCTAYFRRHSADTYANTNSYADTNTNPYAHTNTNPYADPNGERCAYGTRGQRYDSCSADRQRELERQRDR
jgi:hypothetical protein